MVVVGFSNGVFGLYQMPDFVCLHLLSISREKITTAIFNSLGNWLVFGCAKLGQLLVWEWRSESYVLKQQGHYFDVNCIAYSPDSQLLATGADDNKVKVWTVSSGFCFITFSEHTNAVTAVHFMANNHSLLSASLDGTIRAWDLFRYRNFKTFTTPSPRQFVSLTADQSGEVICAGTLDSFEIYVWSMKTGRLLDVLSGHQGPVHGLMFSPINAILASSSWDKTVRLWDVFESKGAVETFQHSHDVLTLAYRPDGRQIACSTLDGLIHFWDPFDGLLMYTIEGRRDIAGGRLMTDRRSAANTSIGKYFTTLCYSADGSYILAGGNSKYICMYDIGEQVLLRRFQITRNLSLDGVLDFLNSKKMTDAGALDLIDDEDSDVDEGIDQQTRGNLGLGLPGSMANRGRPIARTKCVKFAPTGRSFAAATTDGVLLYSVDESFIFDPTDLDIDVTPEKVEEALAENQQQRALLLSLRLNEDSLIKRCIFAVDPSNVQAICSSIPFKYLQRLIDAFADLLERCPHLEFILLWSQELCKVHGNYIQQNSRTLLPALKSLQKSITRLHDRSSPARRAMAPPTRKERAAEVRPSSSKPAATGAIEVQHRRVGGGGWTSRRISIYASRVFFLLIILQIPLFRVPCRAGTCTTPIQVTSSQLVSNEIFPPSVVKAMLYPSAIVSSLTKSMTFPRWSDLFDMYNLTEAKNASAVIDLQRLEILAGSYFCVAGALVGIINPGRMTLFGTLLVIWGLVKEALFGKPVNSDPTESVYVYPTILIALICAFMSITYNVKKTVRSSQPVSISKPLQSSAKSKLK